MNESKVDISVLLIFYNRPDHFQKVFEVVKAAKPSRLFLYQDGPRSEKDLSGISACRKIAGEIDWDCEVHKLFQEKNVGCDPSEFIAQKWAFSITDKCVVLEDDDVPSLSFFAFCKEMLDKYENDERVVMISGFNPDEVSCDVPSDYFFTTFCSIWGWASWRRVIDKWDDKYFFVEDAYSMRKLKELIKDRNYYSAIYDMIVDHSKQGKAYYESIFWAYMLLHNGLAIVPKRNMINNIGYEGETGTHYSGDLACMPKDLRTMFTMQRYELEWPLKHPKYIIDDVEYKNRILKRYAWNHPWIKMRHSLEEFWLNARYGNFSHIKKALKNRMHIIFCGKSYK